MHPSTMPHPSSPHPRHIRHVRRQRLHPHCTHEQAACEEAATWLACRVRLLSAGQTDVRHMPLRAAS